MMNTPSFEQRMQRIEDLVQQIERAPDGPLQDAAREIVRTLLDLHGAGLRKMLELLSTTDREPVLQAWLGDDLVRSLLLLHDLHPDDLESRVRQALDGVRPYLNSHGGDVELLGVFDGAVRLRMQGSCHGCPSSSATLKSTIEGAIYEAAPDVSAVVVEGAAEPPIPAGLVQLSFQQSAFSDRL